MEHKELQIGERYMATSDFTGEDFEVEVVSDGEGDVSLVDAKRGEPVTDIVHDVREGDK